MDGCIYRTKDGECDLYAEGGKFKAFCDMDGCKGRKMSNADRIRSKTDEELAKMFEDFGVCPPHPCPYSDTDKPFTRGDCLECHLEWLKAEV